jgi:hypothetical protein
MRIDRAVKRAPERIVAVQSSVVVRRAEAAGNAVSADRVAGEGIAVLRRTGSPLNRSSPRISILRRSPLRSSPRR